MPQKSDPIWQAYYEDKISREEMETKTRQLVVERDERLKKYLLN